MQMVAGGNAGGAGGADQLSRADDLSGGYAVAAQVHVDGREAVLMVDLHIVAGGIAPACDGNDARTGGVHGVAGAGIQVNTLMVGRSARRGRFTIAEGTGDGGVAAGNQPAAAASSGRTAGVPAAIAAAVSVRTAALRRGGYGGRFPCFPFPLLRRVELYFHGGDLLQERIFLLLAFLFQRFQVIGLLQKLLEQFL